MSVEAAELIENVYLICDTCKEGKTGETLLYWSEHHSQHGPINSVIGRVFLTKYLRDGYIDVDRANLKPLVEQIGSPRATGDTPLGSPDGVKSALAVQRQMRHGHIQASEPASVPVRTAPPQRDPSLRELQLCLPWTVKYSRDFRANPQSHKDFAHAILHIVKATGKLAAIIDDLDHRRDSTELHRVRDYLADLVICAMRAANTMPGGTIDLLPAVQSRVVTKNPPLGEGEPEVET